MSSEFLSVLSERVRVGKKYNFRSSIASSKKIRLLELTDLSKNLTIEERVGKLEEEKKQCG